MSAITYTPGESTAVAGSRAWMLLRTSPDAELVSSVWEHIENADSLDGLVSGLAKVGLDVLPDFALYAKFGRNRHVICRGTASALLVRDNAEPERVDGQGLLTWAEHRLDSDVQQVVLGVGAEPTGLQLPATAGVFLASGIVIDNQGSGSSAAKRRRTSTAPVVEQPAPVVAVPVQESAPEIDLPVALAAPVASEPVEEVNGETGYDFLFSATQARTVEDAAVRADAPVEVEDLPAVIPPAPVSAPREETLEPAHNTGTPSLIDAVPWDAADNASAPSVADAEPAPVDDGSTVKRSDLLKLTSQAVAADRIGPTVHALLCPVSHANPPSSSFCRLCGAALPDQDPVTVPRPVLGVLRLSTGDVIALDRGVVMGRSPRSDFDGGERPHVVKLPSADGEISRTHLQVSLDGWHVLVTDLKSTNGTLVTLPGRDPEQLRPNDPLPIQPGTVVTLADGVDFRYEVAE